MSKDSPQIPNLFRSDADDAPFENCLVCNCDLLATNIPYVVEKAFKKYPALPDVEDATVFEYAICFDCANDMKNSMSQASQNSLTQFIDENLVFKERLHRLLALGDTELKTYLSHCAFTGEPITDSEEYQVLGLFHGPYIQYSAFPYAIGSKGMEIISDLLSNETIDEMNRFRDTHLGGPPELESIFDRKPLIMI